MQIRARLIPAIAMLALTLSACSTTRSVPKPEPLPDKANSFTGVWYSQQFEHMYLKQNGDQVRGRYTYANGGHIEGRVEGNLLVFEWKDSKSKKRARRSMQGQGYLQLVVENGKRKLVGEWGYGKQRTGGGPWRADYLRPLEADDPVDLDGKQN